MQILCKSSGEAVDVSCSVCRQGFAVEWERQTKQERTVARAEILRTLRSHHGRISGPEAHPRQGFLVTAGTEPLTFSGASIGGHAPSWAL
jgi:hypothetical protein